MRISDVSSDVCSSDLLGVLIALWSLWTGIGLPLWKMAAHVATSPRLHRNRRFAIQVTLGGLGALLLLLFVVPAPHHVNAQGVVWLPDEAHVRAGTNGVITRVAVAEGRAVRSGDLLVETRPPALEPEVAKLGWRVAELQAEAESHMAGNRGKPHTH